MRSRLRLIVRLLVAIAAATTACTSDTTAPPLTGPSTSITVGQSGLAQAMTLTVTPDAVSQDGVSQSAVAVKVVCGATANGCVSGQGLSGVAIQLAIEVQTSAGVSQQDCGTLSTKTIVTSSNGTANAVYTAPPPAGSIGCAGMVGNVVQISATPTGNNAASSGEITNAATIRLLPPGGSTVVGAIFPTPSFTASNTTPTVNIPVNFDGTGSCAGTLSSAGACQAAAQGLTITSYAWNFGDGTVGSGATTSHTYTLPGTYNVTLTVTNNVGEVNAVSHTVTVALGSGPTAKFTYSPAAPVFNQVIYFAGDSSTPSPGLTITTWSWDFGDGGTAIGASLYETTHTYAVSGAYTVTLTVSDTSGAKNSTSLQVTVGTGAPTAVITGPSALAVGQQGNFTGDLSTAVGNNTIVSYAWNFGDGTTSNQETLNHAFATAGMYTVSLIVTDSAGHSNSTTLTVTVS